MFSAYPVGGLQFSTLWGRAVELDMGEWCVNFKDYPIPYMLAKDMHFFGLLVGAEEIEESGRSFRECEIHLPAPWETHTVRRNMAPLKFYYDMQCGEIRIRSGLRVFMRTASRYDDSRILFLPDLRLRVVLEYVNDEKSKCAKGSAIWNSAPSQTATGEAFSGITRRRSYVWVPQHVSATLWGTQVHVYSNGHTPSADGLSSSDEETFLLGLTRVSYVRENNRGRDAPQHRLTVHDLKLHMEEEAQSSSSDVQQRDGSTSKDDRGHRRGYSMSDHNQSLLNQLIGEASTKLVAHCEQ
ncbi:hypothetical protein TELCIR_11664, partial [Teladorsagia circumcincta]